MSQYQFREWRGAKPLHKVMTIWFTGVYVRRPSKVWDEITYPFLNFRGATVEV